MPLKQKKIPRYHSGVAPKNPSHCVFFWIFRTTMRSHRQSNPTLNLVCCFTEFFKAGLKWFVHSYNASKFVCN